MSVQNHELETEEPLKALKSKDIHERAAAARDLSKVGQLADIPHLVVHAQSDRSPAVRLGTAGAAADILSRMRVGVAAAELDVEQRRGLLDLFRGVDPSVNGGLFSMLACIGIPEGAQRIFSGLRDPRGDVRVGAGVGLMRLCSSLAAYGDQGLERAVVTLLRDRRLKPDALASIAHVCGAVGYRSARPLMAELNLVGSHAQSLQDALQALDAGLEPPSGAWFSDGRDAGEINPDPPLPPALLWIGADGTIEQLDAGWSLQPRFPSRPLRRMFIRRVGEHERRQAFQDGVRTWYRADDTHLLAAIDLAADIQDLDWSRGQPAYGGAEDAARLLVPQLPQDAPGLRARAILLSGAGAADEALAVLEQATQVRGVPADVWLFLGDALAAHGRTEEARQAWETAVKRARSKKLWFVLQARARLQG